jgi:hypothetical protein
MILGKTTFSTRARSQFSELQQVKETTRDGGIDKNLTKLILLLILQATILEYPLTAPYLENPKAHGQDKRSFDPSKTQSHVSTDQRIRSRHQRIFMVGM